MRIQFLLPFFVDSEEDQYLKQFLAADAEPCGSKGGRATETLGTEGGYEGL